MAAVTYESFLPEVAPHCGGAPEPLIINSIRNAAINFCQRSWCWLTDLAPVGITINVQDYAVTGALPAESTIAQIMYGTYNGKAILPITRAEATALDPDWRNTVGLTPKRFLAKDGATTVSLIPIPSATAAAGGGSGPVVFNGITWSVALKPTRASTGVPDWIYQNYIEDISHGALFRMFSMPKKQWTNANLAGGHKTLFENAAAVARVVASKSFTRAAHRNINTGVARW